MTPFQQIAACALVAFFTTFPSLPGSAQDSAKPAGSPAVNERYIYAVVEMQRLRYDRYRITVDYGQEPSAFRDHVLDSRTSIRHFSSTAEVLNWLSTNGWNLLQVIGDYDATAEGGSTSFSYLIRKNVTGMTASEINRQFNLFSSQKNRRSLDGLQPQQDKDGNFPE